MYYTKDKPQFNFQWTGFYMITASVMKELNIFLLFE